MKIKENIAMSDSGFVFDSNTGDSFNLNSAGREIMNIMKEDKTLNEIQEVMIQKYEVDADVLENSIYDFIGMLRQFNLLDHEK